MKKEMTKVQRAELAEQIYEECLEVVQWSITKKYGHLGRSVVHDALQETWKRMIEHIDELYDKPHKAKVAWLITVATHCIIDNHRATERLVLVDEMESYMELKGVEDDPVSRQAIQRVTAREIMDKFTEEEKELLFAKEKDPLVSSSPDDGSSRNALNCKRYRVRKKLIKYMREGGIDAGK